MTEKYQFRKYFLKNRFFWPVALFILTCLVEWYYLGHQGYHIRLSDEMPGAYRLAKENTIEEILGRIFLHFDYSPGSVRPFVTGFLYVLAFKLTNFNIYSVFYLGILAGSLLVMLYFLIIRDLFSLDVAIASSVTIMLMTNYIEQSLSLTSILTGMIFTAASMVVIISYYNNYALYTLYLSGIFLIFSLLSRYENAILIPFFILYNIFFDRKTPLRLKLGYWLICAAGPLYLAAGSLLQGVDPLHFIREQNINALKDVGGAIGFSNAAIAVKTLMNRLIAWPMWLSGIGGAFLLSFNKKPATHFLLAYFLSIFVFLFCKISNGTLLYDSPEYFLISAVAIIPLSFEFLKWVIRIIFKTSFCSHIFLALIVLVLAMKFNIENLLLRTINFPKERIAIIDDLSKSGHMEHLYIAADTPSFDDPFGPSILYYLRRHPWHYFFTDEMSLDNIPYKKFYMLTTKKKISRIFPRNQRVTLCRDYGDIGLYEVGLIRR